MKVINIIIILLLIFFIGLNIYYAVYIKRLHLQNNDELFTADMLPDEDFDLKASYTDFQKCDKALNKGCTSTFEKYNSLDPNDPFFTTYSKYHENYKYKNIINANSGYKWYNDIMTFKNLLSYMCINKSPNELVNVALKGKYPYIFKKIYLYDEDTLNKFIRSEIEHILKISDCSTFDPQYPASNQLPTYCGSKYKLDITNNKSSVKLFGPIYVFISQAPYLRTGQEGKTMISARHDVIYNNRAYYIEKTQNGRLIVDSETTDENGKFSSLYAEIAIVFPLYEETYITNNPQNSQKYTDITHLKLTQNPQLKLNQFINDMQTYKIRSELCKLRCNKQDAYCGCLNAKEEDMETNGIPYHNKPFIASSLLSTGIHKYNSECLGIESEKSVKQNTSFMFFLNPYGSLFQDMVSNYIR
jgi:hypothetical protein